MSWWWKPTPASSSGKGNATPIPTATTPDEAVASPAVAAPPVSEPAKRALTREEQADQEWFSFLKELQADGNGGHDTNSTLQQKGTLPQTDISLNSFYPTEMSCRSSFDYAMFCQSFGGQFVNVYRYGDFRSCSNHWDDFWHCMRTRNYSKEHRERAIQEHYRKKAVKWKTGPSSEDVWEVRTEPVKNPISGNLATLEAELAQLKKDHPAV